LPWYESILASAEGFEREWKHYGKKYGWKLKAHDGRKALFELTIGTAGLRVTHRRARKRDDRPSRGFRARPRPPPAARESKGRLGHPPSDHRPGELRPKAQALIGAVAKIRRED